MPTDSNLSLRCSYQVHSAHKYSQNWVMYPEVKLFVTSSLVPRLSLFPPTHPGYEAMWLSADCRHINWFNYVWTHTWIGFVLTLLRNRQWTCKSTFGRFWTLHSIVLFSGPTQPSFGCPGDGLVFLLTWAWQIGILWDKWAVFNIDTAPQIKCWICVNTLM